MSLRSCILFGTFLGTLPLAYIYANPWPTIAIAVVFVVSQVFDQDEKISTSDAQALWNAVLTLQSDFKGGGSDLGPLKEKLEKVEKEMAEVRSETNALNLRAGFGKKV